MEEAIYKDLEAVLTPEEINARVAEMSAEICRDLGDNVPVVVGILKGAFIFMSDLIREMNIHVEVDFAQISSYGDGTSSSGRIKVLQDITTPVDGRDVIVVEDIIDTGATLAYIQNMLKLRAPMSLEVCTLLKKDAPLTQEVTIKYVGKEIPDVFVVGYGLDYKEKFRYFPYITELVAESDM